DDEPGHATQQQIEHAVKLHAEIMAMASAEQDLPQGEEKISFYLAGSLPLDLDFKQTILEMRSEAERMEAIITAFTTILTKLTRTVQVRQKRSEEHTSELQSR